MNPFELFAKEFPQLAERFDHLLNTQRELPGLDPETKQLINIARQTAVRNPRGVEWLLGLGPLVRKPWGRLR